MVEYLYRGKGLGLPQLGMHSFADSSWEALLSELSMGNRDCGLRGKEGRERETVVAM